MFESGQEDVRPLNPRIVKDIGNIVKAKGFDKEPKPETTQVQPLNDRAQEEIGHIVKATGFDELPEERTKLLPTAEREKIRSFYNEFIEVLPTLGFDFKDEAIFPHQFGKRFHFLGVDGGFRISVGNENGQRFVLIEKDDKRYLASESYRISEDGTASKIRYRRGVPEETENIGGTSDKKDPLVLAKMSKFLDPILSSAKNPEYSIRSIRAKVREVRKSLMDILGKQGIEPSAVEYLERRDRGVFTKQVDKVYKDVIIPGLKGGHDISFAHFDVVPERGIGVIITESKYRDDKESSGKGIELWENGDANADEGFIIDNSFDPEAYRELYPLAGDPHLVLKECLRLERVVTGKHLPQDMIPLIGRKIRW